MFSHQPFRKLDPAKYRLQTGEVVMVDDEKMTKDDSNQMMFNLLRVLVFRPVTIRDFVARFTGPLRDTQSSLDKSGAAAFNVLTYEIVEDPYRLPNGTGRSLPILSRFGSLATLLDFISKNRLLAVPHNLYGVRVCLAHYVSDCFLYKVVNGSVFGRSGILSGSVQIQPLNMFACGKNQTKLAGKANVGKAQSVRTHVPNRIRSGTPASLWNLDGDADMYWLPLMEKIDNPDEIELKMRQSYSFHEESDLAFPEAVKKATE